jgi:hypothetical protein
MSDTFKSGCMSSTTKSTSTKKSLIFTGMFSAIHSRQRIDWSANWMHIDVGSSVE